MLIVLANERERALHVTEPRGKWDILIFLTFGHKIQYTYKHNYKDRLVIKTNLKINTNKNSNYFNN